MFEISNLSELMIDYASLEKAINTTINEKIYVRKGLKSDIYKIPEEAIFYSISNLLKDTSYNYICITLNNVIEWTPVKLFQSLYFLVHLHDKFWVIYKDAYKCNVVLEITIIDYLKYLYNIGVNSDYLDSLYWPSFSDFNIGLNTIKSNNLNYAFIKRVNYSKTHNLFHYLYKYDHIYFITVCYTDNKISIYKPIVYKLNQFI